MKRPTDSDLAVDLWAVCNILSATQTHSGAETSPEILMLGYLCIKGADNLPEKVNILDRFALADADIATIVVAFCNPTVMRGRTCAREPKPNLDGKGEQHGSHSR